jgi:hypothetical protein
MAVTFTAERIGSEDGTAILAKWETVTESDTPDGWEVSDFDDLTIQVIGNFGAGGTIQIQGSLDGANWVVLDDKEGAALSLTAAGLRGVQDMPRYIRPMRSAGTGIDVDVFIRAKRISSKRT